MFGWEELAAQVAAVYDGLPADERAQAGLMTESYGEAAALDLFGPDHGLPRTTSPHNNYFFWGPPEAQTVVAVAWSRARLERVFEIVEQAESMTNALGVRNEASQQSIFICRGPLRSWDEIWKELRFFV